MQIQAMGRVFFVVNQFISKGDMEMLRLLSKGFSAAICLLVLAFPSSAKAEVIYSQPSNFPTFGAVASQFEQGVIDFAAFDDFTLTSSSTVTDVHWQGEFLNPSVHATIESFTVQFWSDNTGQPGSSLSSQTILGNANETFVGIGSGTFAPLVYDYSVDLVAPFNATGGTQYWLSIVANMPFPPQWALQSGTGGDGISYSSASGTLRQVATDLAFELTSVPEPSTFLLLGAGLAGVGLLRRRFRE